MLLVTNSNSVNVGRPLVVAGRLTRNSEMNKILNEKDERLT